MAPRTDRASYENIVGMNTNTGDSTNFAPWGEMILGDVFDLNPFDSEDQQKYSLVLPVVVLMFYFMRMKINSNKKV